MNRELISRRRMILASSGALVSSTLIRTPNLFTQEIFARQEYAKDLIFRSAEPRNAEPELAKLAKSWLTPTELFYVRSHAPNPRIDASLFRLTVEGLVQRPAEFSLAELKSFPDKSTTATLTCAGNRRAEYNGPGYESMPEVGGVLWQGGTIGNATWSGTLLADVLKRVELKEGAKHVWFEGLDQIPKDGNTIAFGGSIPIEKAMTSAGAGAPLLAYTMNDALLTPDHGFPLRMVVPGYIGARSVKWLGKIVVSDRPSPNHYVATAYKIVENTDPLDWSESGPIYRFPINGAICLPHPNEKVAPGQVEVVGYVLPSGRSGNRVKDVLISADDGKTWTRAELTGTDQDYCWQLWKARINVKLNTSELLMRATDSSGCFMPVRAPWNAKGYLQNSWYRLPIKVG